MNLNISAAPAAARELTGPAASGFPIQRMRRLRGSPALRRLVRETLLTRDDLILPLFVTYGKGVQREIGSMPGVYQWSVDRLQREAEDIARLGIPGVILFGIPDGKDEHGQRQLCAAWGGAGGDPGDQERRSRPARHDRRVHVRIHEPRPLRDRDPIGAGAGRSRSTTTRPSRCWAGSPSRTSKPAPTWSLPAR